MSCSIQQTKAIFGFNTLSLDKLMKEVKAVAVQPVAVGISAKQAHGERFQAFAAKVRGLTTDCKYILPCPHAVAAAQVCTIVDCRGVDYTPEVIKDILLSGIYDHDVRHEVLGSSSIEDKSVNDLIRFVEAKEAARDAAVGSRLAAAAAAASSSYKKSSRQDSSSRPQQQQQRNCPPIGVRPKKLQCRCGNEFSDYAVRSNGSANQSPYESCRDCFLKSRKPGRESKGGRSNVAAAASGGLLAKERSKDLLGHYSPHQRQVVRAAGRRKLCGTREKKTPGPASKARKPIDARRRKGPPAKPQDANGRQTKRGARRLATQRVPIPEVNPFPNHRRSPSREPQQRASHPPHRRRRQRTKAPAPSSTQDSKPPGSASRRPRAKCRQISKRLREDQKIQVPPARC